MNRNVSEHSAQLRLAMELLEGTSPPPRLLARANTHALRMLRRTIRASEEAQQLVHNTPRMNRLFVVHRLRQVALSSAAVIAMMILRTGMLTGLEEGRRLTELLAQTHVDRHIYGDLDETET